MRGENGLFVLLLAIVVDLNRVQGLQNHCHIETTLFTPNAARFRMLQYHKDTKQSTPKAQRFRLPASRFTVEGNRHIALRGGAGGNDGASKIKGEAAGMYPQVFVYTVVKGLNYLLGWNIEWIHFFCTWIPNVFERQPVDPLGRTLETVSFSIMALASIAGSVASCTLWDYIGQPRPTLPWTLPPTRCSLPIDIAIFLLDVLAYARNGVPLIRETKEKQDRFKADQARAESWLASMGSKLEQASGKDEEQAIANTFWSRLNAETNVHPPPTTWMGRALDFMFSWGVIAWMIPGGWKVAKICCGMW
mmetsp:Transcript_58303/g.119235  ORF Transcript_58303/g.119235 Transcript_58303/m.119235 type:complete len:305 (+) Transcript_58303:151-1065(+)